MEPALTGSQQPRPPSASLLLYPKHHSLSASLPSGWEAWSHIDLTQYSVTTGLSLLPPGNLLVNDVPTVFPLKVNSDPPSGFKSVTLLGHSFSPFLLLLLTIRIFHSYKTLGLSLAFHLLLTKTDFLEWGPGHECTSLTLSLSLGACCLQGVWVLILSESWSKLSRGEDGVGCGLLELPVPGWGQECVFGKTWSTSSSTKCITNKADVFNLSPTPAMISDLAFKVT